MPRGACFAAEQALLLKKPLLFMLINVELTLHGLIRSEFRVGVEAKQLQLCLFLKVIRE